MKKIEIKELGYPVESLEPVISREIMSLHYGKHYSSYVNGANSAIEKLEKYRKGELELNVREVLRDLSFNFNGAKMHEIFWSSMRPVKENNLPTEDVITLLATQFESFEAFKREFSAAAVGVEGSGWAVLWKDTDANMQITQLEKHNYLAPAGMMPVLALDVWEHAYYLQYLNDRAKYVESWWSLVNWEFVGKQLKS